MTTEQLKSLGAFWVSRDPATLEDFVKAIQGTPVYINTVPEFLTFKGACARLSVAEQIAVHANIKTIIPPALTNLFLQAYKVEQELGNSALSEVNNILNKKA